MKRKTKLVAILSVAAIATATISMTVTADQSTYVPTEYTEFTPHHLIPGLIWCHIFGNVGAGGSGSSHGSGSDHLKERS